ncbi:50S ribosomal protein L35ae [Aeropyrum camini]|uniref:Large ribosomal subunit protein eL33 n=1 Tax=Aeropyrum camini SY1 = JCM 12091 TaxID=1198449 RepID=U3TEQ2_9CREN|nr:50S ribosomal protein L35ae [Aeropyrum camini]BAN90926.1 50S ribosomal protein L35 [Aeropyrum camini SY1 = JCM 12091]
MARVRGVILGYRRGTNTQYTQHALVKLLLDDPRKAGLYVSGTALYRDRYGNVYKGRVLRLHGRRGGVVVVRFKPPLPGQAVGGVAEVVKEEGGEG